MITQVPVPQNMAEWKEQNANAALFRMKGSTDSEAVRLLTMNKTNRILTAEQARLFSCLVWQAKRLGPHYAELAWWLDEVQALQLTIGAPENSRKSFVQVLTAELRAAAQKAQGFLGKMLGGGSDQ